MTEDKKRGNETSRADDRASLGDFIRQSPLAGSNIDLQRDKSRTRDEALFDESGEAPDL